MASKTRKPRREKRAGRGSSLTPDQVAALVEGGELPEWHRTPAVTRDMNGDEAAYAMILRDELDRGEIAGFAYEADTLCLSDRMVCSYCPDFKVYLHDGTWEYREIKGGLRRESDWIKFKWAAEKFCGHTFVLASLRKAPKRSKHKGRRWVYKRYPAIPGGRTVTQADLRDRRIVGRKNDEAA